MTSLKLLALGRMILDMGAGQKGQEWTLKYVYGVSIKRSDQKTPLAVTTLIIQI